MSVTTYTTPDGAEVFRSKIHQALQEYMDDRGLETMENQTQNKWNACLYYIEEKVFSDRKQLKRKPYDNKDNKAINPTNNNAYDLELIDKLCDVYINLCDEYSKECNLYGFSRFIGIDYSVLMNWENNYNKRNMVSTLGGQIVKKLAMCRESSLSGMLLDKGRNPVGVLGILNHAYGWNMPGVRNDTAPRQVLTAAELPKLGNSSVGIEQKTTVTETAENNE